MQLEEGHYYRTHNKLANTRAGGRYVSSQMEPLCDGVPRKCTFAEVRYGSIKEYDIYAVFEGIEFSPWNFCSSDFEEVPLLHTIDTADWLSPATKDYALQAVIDCILGKNGECRNVGAATFMSFCHWKSTKEGEDWWRAIDSKRDPGVPNSSTSGPAVSAKPCLCEITTIPVGTRVRVARLAKGEAHRPKSFVGVEGEITGVHSEYAKLYAKTTEGEVDHWTIDKGAMCEILEPAETPLERGKKIHREIASAMEPGWRILGPDEIIREGDECRYKDRECRNDSWDPSLYPGEKVSLFSEMEYRRRVDSDLVPIESLPVGTRIKIVKLMEGDATVASARLDEECTINLIGDNAVAVMYDACDPKGLARACPSCGTLVRVISYPNAEVRRVPTGVHVDFGACDDALGLRKPRPKPRVHVERETFSYTPHKSASWAKVLRSLKTK